MGKENGVFVRLAESNLVVDRDVDAILRLMGRDVRRLPRSGDEVRGLMRKGGVVVADHPLGVVGFALFEVDGPSSATINSLYALPSFNPEEVTNKLAEECLRNVGLRGVSTVNVMVSDRKQRELLTCQGFVQLGPKPNRLTYIF